MKEFIKKNRIGICVALAQIAVFGISAVVGAVIM